MSVVSFRNLMALVEAVRATILYFVRPFHHLVRRLSSRSTFIRATFARMKLTV
jgi:hypothetical protein